MKFFYKIIFIFLCIAWLSACSRITQENFNKIQPGMPMTEVINILGEPTTSESFNIAGISGTSASWKYHNAEIMIQFLNDRVQIKTFSNSGSNSNRGNTGDTESTAIN